jgi:hypothetical protein
VLQDKHGSEPGCPDLAAQAILPRSMNPNRRCCCCWAKTRCTMPSANRARSPDRAVEGPTLSIGRAEVAIAAEAAQAAQ